MSETPDVNDFAKQHGPDMTREALDGMPGFNPGDVKDEGPGPLMRELPPADRFPVDALGDVLGGAARAIHDRVQAPLAIGAQSVLAMATLAVQGHADVVLPIGSQDTAKPVSDYFGTVALSGERKSECDTQASWPIQKREKALREKYDGHLPSYINDKLAWDEARKKAINKAKGNRGEIKKALDALGPAPIPPLEPMLTCPEPTFEGLCKLFTVGQPSLGLFSTEGGQFIGGHGMNQDNKLKTATGLCNLWDGTSTRRVRAGDGASVLPGRRLSVHLMAQPDVADILLSDPLLIGQGLLSRMLVTAPDSTAGSRLWRDEQAGTDGALKRYDARLLDILERPLPLAVGKSNELEPRKLPLAMEARDRWIKFHDYVENQLREGGKLEPVRGLANKLPEHAARLAAVLSLVSDIETSAVRLKEMEAGIKLACHYATEALRLGAASRVSNDLRLAKKLLDWLHHHWNEPVISLPDIYQRGLNAIGDVETAKKCVSKLEENGWLQRIPGGAIVGGVRRRDAWRIVGKGVIL